MNLYWVKTKDNFENWFMVAPTKEIACDCHECFEGFNEGDASAEFLCPIPVEIELKYKTKIDNIDEGYWPSRELLKDLGFEFIEEFPPCIVRGQGRLFHEGGSSLALTLKHLDNRKGIYLVNIRNTSKFKIGITKKISRRLKEIKTSNPFTIDLWYFIECENLRKVERSFHNIFKTKRLSGEWFEIVTFDEIFSAIEDLGKIYKMGVHNILDIYEKM